MVEDTGSRKRAVIAIGGNSLIKDKAHLSVPDQYAAAKETCYHIADMVSCGWDLAIGHGNGPQVGFILRRSDIASKVAGMHKVPLDFCGADSQGALGYTIQQNLIKDRVIRVDSEFFFRSDQYRSAGHLGTGTGQGRDPNVIGRGVFHQIPSLIGHRGTRVGQHYRDGLGDVHDAATADSHHSRGNGFADFQNKIPGFIHLGGGGLMGHIDPKELIVGLNR